MGVGPSQSKPGDAPQMAKRATKARSEWKLRMRRDQALLFGKNHGGAAAVVPRHAEADAALARAEAMTEDSKLEAGSDSEPDSAVGAERAHKATVTTSSLEPIGEDRGARPGLLLAKYASVDLALERLEDLCLRVMRRTAYQRGLENLAFEVRDSSPARAEHLTKVSAYAKNEAVRDAGRHDQAAAAIDWLRKDYTLSVNLARASEAFDQARTAVPKDRAAIDAAKRARAEAEKELAEHEASSLIVGLRVLDTNFSGSVEPDDFKGMNMPLELFTKLDISSNKRVTASDLEKYVKRTRKARDAAAKKRDEASDALEDAEGKLEAHLEAREQGKPESAADRTQRERLEVGLQRARKNFNDRRDEVRAAQASLDRVYHLFGTAFTKHVLGVLDMSAEEASARVKSIRDMIAAEDAAVAADGAPEQLGPFDASKDP